MKNNISYEINNKNPEDRKHFIRNLFDSIVPTYDVLNHLLSAGIDISWRRNIFKYLSRIQGEPVVDLCCGTGDLSLLLHRQGAKVVSIDFSIRMLQKGMDKKAIKGFPIASDVCKIPFRNDIFTAATIAFGIRNIPDIDNFIKEVFRVLAPGGMLVILELVRPNNRFIRFLYSFYLGYVIPFLGGIISRKYIAYKYLSKTIETFINPVDLHQMLDAYGFKNIQKHPQTFGVATIIVCHKES